MREQRHRNKHSEFVKSNKNFGFGGTYEYTVTALVRKTTDFLRPARTSGLTYMGNFPYHLDCANLNCERP